MEQKGLTKKDINSMFLRSNFLLGSMNFERVQAMGYCFTMIPAIKRFYQPGPERNAALKRHLEWFNTHPWLTAPIFGVTAAMEEEHALVGEQQLPGSSGSVGRCRRSDLLGDSSSSFGSVRCFFSFKRQYWWTTIILFIDQCHSFSNQIFRFEIRL